MGDECSCTIHYIAFRYAKGHGVLVPWPFRYVPFRKEGWMVQLLAAPLHAVMMASSNFNATSPSESVGDSLTFAELDASYG